MKSSRLSLRSVVVAFWLAAAVVAPAEAVSLLQNGDFETGNLTGWTVVNSDSALQQAVLAAPATLSPPLSGLAYKIRPGNQAPNAGIFQVIPTVLGETYIWSIDTAVRQLQGGNHTETFELRLDGSTVATVTYTDGQQHTNSFGGMYTAPGTSVDFRLVFNRDAHSFTHNPQWLADNAVFAPIPEPGTVTLLAVGTIALCLVYPWRRHRSRESIASPHG